MASIAPEVARKIVEDLVAVQKADISVIGEKRGGKFRISDAAPYVDAVKKMEPLAGMKKEVIDLHVNSVVAHFEILRDIAKNETILPKDDPFVEHYQTPVVLEVLYELDPKLREAVEKFVASFDKPEIRAFIGREAFRKATGYYGPTCVVDFAVSVGGMSGIFATILDKLDIDPKYKETILAAKSWGMNTSYGFGVKFIQAVEAGKTLKEAVDEEIARLKEMWLSPVETQVKVMQEAKHESFDPAEYMKRYRARMESFIKAAFNAGVHPGNICVVPAYCVGDVGHHIAQSMYNMAKDDVTFAIMEAVTGVLESTMKKLLDAGKLTDPYRILRAATGSTATAVVYILGLDGFTVPMVIDLLVKRFFNYVLKYPTRGAAAELHNVDFMDMLVRGERILAPPPIGKGGKIMGVDVDLTPIKENYVLMHPEEYTYPGCAITVRFSSLMRLADFPCLLTSEPVTATVNTYIVALHPDKVVSPPMICKDCGPSRLLSGRRFHCYYRTGVTKKLPLY